MAEDYKTISLDVDCHCAAKKLFFESNVSKNNCKGMSKATDNFR